MSLEELESKHRKELKSLDGEKRAAIKKVKGTKGKKAKDGLADVEAHYEAKLKETQTRHQQELQAFKNAGADSGATDTSVSVDVDVDVDVEEHTSKSHKPQSQTQSINNESTQQTKQDQNDEMKNLTEKERKQLKARRKKERQKEKERLKQEQIQHEIDNAGPSMRQLELDQIQNKLTPLNLEIKQVEADGNCMYRAVGAQLQQSFHQIRELCADTLMQNSDDFVPFCEYTDDVSTFDQYVDRVRNSAEWGGHLELRAIGLALKRTILVYSAQSTEPLVVHEEPQSDHEPVRLSYHLHYYALGEHYNQVVKKI